MYNIDGFYICNMNKFFIVFLFFLGTLQISIAQTQEEVRNFINKSPVSIWKAQKELNYRSAVQYSSELKDAYRNQLYAIELYKQGKNIEALEYSYASRERAMALLGKIGVKIPKETLIEAFEAVFFTQRKSFKPDPKLDATQAKRLNDCNILNATETSAFSLQILK